MNKLIKLGGCGWFNYISNRLQTKTPPLPLKANRPMCCMLLAVVAVVIVACHCLHFVTGTGTGCPFLCCSPIAVLFMQPARQKRISKQATCNTNRGSNSNSNSNTTKWMQKYKMNSARQRDNCQGEVKGQGGRGRAAGWPGHYCIMEQFLNFGIYCHCRSAGVCRVSSEHPHKSTGGKGGNPRKNTAELQRTVFAYPGRTPHIRESLS